MPAGVPAAAVTEARDMANEDLIRAGWVARYFQDLWMGLFRRPPFRLIRPARRA